MIFIAPSILEPKWRLNRPVGPTWDRTDRYRVILIREELVEGPTSRQEHIELASAIGARKAAPAARLMRAHIERSHTRIADIVKTRATDSVERLGPGSRDNP